MQKDELDLSDDEEHDQDLIQFKKKELVVEDVKDKLQTNHEQIYIFCLLWSMGAFLENNDRMKFESYLNKHTKLKMPKIPDGDSIFNYNVDVHTGEWSHWNNLIQVSTLWFDIYCIFFLNCWRKIFELSYFLTVLAFFLVSTS